MAATPTPKPTASELTRNPCSAALAGWPSDLAEHAPLGVALSGGADSTALLLAAAERWPGRVQALHVHHGLQSVAEDFVRHCEALCERLGVPLEVGRVDGRHASGQSPEDAARQARYRELARLAGARGLGRVLLAQHGDDQVETVLLALSRGAGVPGLAGMAAEFERHGQRFVRPLLALGAAEIRDWLAGQGVSWVEDPFNTDPAYTRSRIRQHLLPALAQTFSVYRETFARSASHAAQAKQLLAELAAIDLAGQGATPSIRVLQALSSERQANALRYWLLSEHQVAASAAQLAELQSQLAACTTRAHAIRIRVAAGWVMRRGEHLAYTAAL